MRRSLLGGSIAFVAMWLLMADGAEAGRWKVGPSGCYWDDQDIGVDQCTPGGSTTGRWKLNGTQCYFDANDSGPNQCTPSTTPPAPGSGGGEPVGCHHLLANAPIGNRGVITFGEAEPKFTIWIKNNLDLPQAAVALDAAVAEWNAKSSVTRTEFKVLKTPQELTLMPHLTIDQNELWGCGGVQGDKILFKRNDLRDVANNNPANAQFMMAHELGHFLGLKEAGNAYSPPNPPSIMNQIVTVNGGSCVDVFSSSTSRPPTTTIQPLDATIAKGCSAVARNNHGFPAPPIAEERPSAVEPWIVHVYLRNETYWCLDGVCWLISVTYTYVGDRHI